MAGAVNETIDEIPEHDSEATSNDDSEPYVPSISRFMLPIEGNYSKLKFEKFKFINSCSLLDWNTFFVTPGLFNEDINTIHSDLNDKTAFLSELQNLLAQKENRKTLYDNFVVSKFDYFLNGCKGIVRKIM